MKILFLLLLATPVLAGEFLEFGDKNFAQEKTEKSKWALLSGFQFIQFPLSLPEFDGQHNRTKQGDLADAYGISIGFGREFYLGAGVSSTLLFSGNYFNSINKLVGIAAEDIDLDIANTRVDTVVYSYEATLSLNYLFDNKVVDFQPFIEGGLGLGTALIEKEYTRKALPDEVDGSEDYDVQSEEDFLYTKASLGMNIIAFDGLVSYVKLTALYLNKTNREVDGSSKLYGSSTTVEYDINEEELDESDTVYTASIGMGYLF